MERYAELAKQEFIQKHKDCGHNMAAFDSISTCNGMKVDRTEETQAKDAPHAKTATCTMPHRIPAVAF